VVDDGADLEPLMNRFLRAVSFGQGEQPAYGELHELFIDGAKLIKNGGERPEICGVAEFIRPRQQLVARGAISTQFVRTPGGWRIGSMAWDDERPGLELPARDHA